MSFAGKVWRLLVGIKDALALLFLLLFFVTLFALLSTRPSPGANVRGGALLLDLDGAVVEEASVPDPLGILLAQELPAREYQLRDILRALDAAAGDERIKAVVLDLREFTGGGHVHMQDIARALDRVRAADKPVLAYSLAYTDDALMLASHASEVWTDPLGGALVFGPGGHRQYYKGLFERFAVTSHVYRVGTYKSAVEPYMLSEMSPEARANYEALYGVMWEEWQAKVKQARPDADLARVTGDVTGWIAEHGGNVAEASRAAGLVDTIGSWEDFAAHVAGIAGEDRLDKKPGAFLHTELRPWLASLPEDRPGKAIGVVTVAGEIVDGDSGPGIAGGARIARLLDEALDDDLAALVVRVDSPGGTVTGSEEIRRAILRHKDKGIPIVVSMANLAASGGYWVSTPANRIFAEPETVTGSIGIFGWVPSFEQTLARYGVTSDGVRTTAISGQPDILGGFTPETDALLQQAIEFGYDQFLTRVAEGRGKTKAEVDTIAQGRVWDGGSARQMGLVDQFGGIDDALAWAAGKAGLEEGEWHAQYLAGGIDPAQALILQLLNGEDGRQRQPAGLFGLVAQRQEQLGARITADLERILGSAGMQAYCLECPVTPGAGARSTGASGRALLRRLLLD